MNDWTNDLAGSLKNDRRISDSELSGQLREFLTLFEAAIASGKSIENAEWTPVRDFLDSISRSRALQGFTSDETASFIFFLQETAVLSGCGKNSPKIRRPWRKKLEGATELLDKLGLYTTKSFQKSREDIISRQQEELLELSTPVVKLWDGILALPMIGTLDSARTQVVMETLLQRITSRLGQKLRLSTSQVCQQ